MTKTSLSVLLTGATGLVGRHIVGKSVHESFDVVGLGRDERMLEILRDMNITTKYFDLKGSEEEFEELLEFGGEDWVWIHAAAAIPGATEDTLEEVNVEGTRKLIQMAKKAKVTQFILISSISTYGTDENESINENTEQKPDSMYGESKLIQEQLLMNSGLTYTIFRPPYIGGPYDRNFLEEIGSRIERKKMPKFSKNGMIPYIDVRDLAIAVTTAIDNEDAYNEDYNIQGTAITMHEFLDLMAHKMGIMGKYGPTYPYWWGMIVGFFAEIWSAIMGKSNERGISRYRIRSLSNTRVFDTKKVEQELDYVAKYHIEDSIDDWLETRK